MRLLIASACLLLHLFGHTSVRALEQYKADVAEDWSHVNVNDPSGANTAQGSKNGDDAVQGNFNVNGNQGDVGGHFEGGGSNVGATGSQGEQQSGAVDANALTASFTGHTGDKVETKTDANGKHTEAIVNGGDKYDVEHPSADTAKVIAPNGRTFDVKGIQKQDVFVEGADHPYEAKYVVQEGKGINTRLKEHTVGNFGPAHESVLFAPDSKTDGGAKLGTSPFDSGDFKNPLSSINPSITLTVDKIKTEPCPEKQYADAFGDNGFRIIDDSISVELPPVSEENGVKTYLFPGCFIVHANVQIPPNIDVNDVGGQVQATMAQAGELQCDTSLTCKSGAQNKPQGSCFFCDFCEKDSGSSKSGAVFGKETNVDWNICQGRPGAQLPLEWKVCPQDGDSNYNVLQQNFFNFKSDIEAAIRIYLKKKGKKPSFCSGLLAGLYPQCKSADASSTWQLVGCKKSVISYRISTGVGQIGSSKADPGSSGSKGGSNSNGFGNIGNLFNFGK